MRPSIPATAADRRSPAGKMIGLAFSHLQNSENISYIIPNEEIDLFLKDIADGHYDGKPAMYDSLQTLENPALRGYLKLDPAVKGMIVTRPDEGVKDNPLKAWDVITRIGDTEIDNEGMVKVSEQLRVNFFYLIQKLAHDGSVPLTLVRSGRTQSVQMPVPTHRPMLVESLLGEYPSYFIYGPLVFSRCSLESMGLVRARGSFSPLLAHLADPPSPEREELVLIASPLFPNDALQGLFQPQRPGHRRGERRDGAQSCAARGLPARPEGRVRRGQLRRALERGAGVPAREARGDDRGHPHR